MDNTVYAVRFDGETCTGIKGPLAHWECTEDESLDPHSESWESEDSINGVYWYQHAIGGFAEYDARTAAYA